VNIVRLHLRTYPDQCFHPRRIRPRRHHWTNMKQRRTIQRIFNVLKHISAVNFNHLLVYTTTVIKVSLNLEHANIPNHHLVMVAE
jgi:hypothetical protein